MFSEYLMYMYDSYQKFENMDLCKKTEEQCRDEIYSIVSDSINF